MLAGTYNMLAEQGSTLYRVLSLEYPDGLFQFSSSDGVAFDLTEALWGVSLREANEAARE